MTDKAKKKEARKGQKSRAKNKSAGKTGGRQGLSKSSTDRGEKEVQYKGLCSTCEIRETCSFPKPEWGVWQCDEYR